VSGGDGIKGRISRGHRLRDSPFLRRLVVLVRLPLRNASLVRFLAEEPYLVNGDHLRMSGTDLKRTLHKIRADLQAGIGSLTASCPDAHIIR
jgi:hypothetical protein